MNTKLRATLILGTCFLGSALVACGGVDSNAAADDALSGSVAARLETKEDSSVSARPLPSAPALASFNGTSDCRGSAHHHSELSVGSDRIAVTDSGMGGSGSVTLSLGSHEIVVSRSNDSGASRTTRFVPPQRGGNPADYAHALGTVHGYVEAVLAGNACTAAAPQLEAAASYLRILSSATTELFLASESVFTLDTSCLGSSSALGGTIKLNRDRVEASIARGIPTSRTVVSLDDWSVWQSHAGPEPEATQYLYRPVPGDDPSAYVRALSELRVFLEALVDGNACTPSLAQAKEAIVAVDDVIARARSLPAPTIFGTRSLQFLSYMPPSCQQSDGVTAIYTSSRQISSIRYRFEPVHFNYDTDLDRGTEALTFSHYENGTQVTSGTVQHPRNGGDPALYRGWISELLETSKTLVAGTPCEAPMVEVKEAVDYLESVIAGL